MWFFLPIALNYDRMLEATVLTRLAKNGEQRIRVGIGVIKRYTSKQLWRYLVECCKRIGVASARYATPNFAEGASSRTRRDLTIDLAREQMRRIGAALPFVPLPATCRLLRQDGKMFDEDLKSRLPELSGEALARCKEKAVADAINQLVERRILPQENGILRSSGEQSELLAGYAAASEPTLRFVYTAYAENLSAYAGS